jgi:hypothetical protein
MNPSMTSPTQPGLEAVNEEDWLTRLYQPQVQVLSNTLVIFSKAFS